MCLSHCSSVYTISVWKVIRSLCPDDWATLVVSTLFLECCRKHQSQAHISTCLWYTFVCRGFGKEKRFLVLRQEGSLIGLLTSMLQIHVCLLVELFCGGNESGRKKLWNLLGLNPSVNFAFFCSSGRIFSKKMELRNFFLYQQLFRS